MPNITTVRVNLRDSRGMETSRSYGWTDGSMPDDSDVIALMDALQNITQLEVLGATASKKIAYNGTSPDPGSTIAEVASLTVLKSQSDGGGKYTFRLPQAKETLIEGSALVISDNAFRAWVELFDDGSGLQGVAGPWTVSNGEKLAEGTNGDSIISGHVDD